MSFYRLPLGVRLMAYLFLAALGAAPLVHRAATSLRASIQRYNQTMCQANRRTLQGAVEMYQKFEKKPVSRFDAETLKAMRDLFARGQVPSDPGYPGGTFSYVWVPERSLAVCLHHGVAGPGGDRPRAFLENLGLGDEELLGRALEDRRQALPATVSQTWAAQETWTKGEEAPLTRVAGTYVLGAWVLLLGLGEGLGKRFAGGA